MKLLVTILYNEEWKTKEDVEEALRDAGIEASVEEVEEHKLYVQK